MTVCHDPPDPRWCVVCAVDAYQRWLGERAARRERVRSERGRDLDALWIDLGGNEG